MKKRWLCLAVALALAWPLSGLVFARGGGGGGGFGGPGARMGGPGLTCPRALGAGGGQRLRLRDGSCLQVGPQVREREQTQTQDRERTQTEERERTREGSGVQD